MASAASGYRSNPQLNQRGLRSVGDAQAASPTEAEGTLSDALRAIATYIPTEILTTYLAVVAAIHSTSPSKTGQWLAFWFFLVAAPATVWTLFATNQKGQGRPIPFDLRRWPAWEMVAATLSFASWAYAMPNSPFSEFTWYSAALGSVAVLLGAFVLGLLAPLFQPRSA